MNDIINYSIPWVQFFTIFLVCGLLVIIYFFLLKPIANRVKLHYGDQETNSFGVAERIGIVVLIAIVLISLLLVNPLLHGFLLLVLIFLSKEAIINVILGALLIREFNLKEGVKISAHNFEGVLYKLGWTGVHLTSVKNIDFISYKYLYNNGISKSQEFVPSLARLRCSHKTIEDERLVFNLLRGKLITYPFLLEGSTPDFVVKGNSIEMTLGLISTKHLNSLVDSLQSAGFNVEILENI